MGLVQSTRGRVAQGTDSPESPDQPGTLAELAVDVDEDLAETGEDYGATLERQFAKRMAATQGMMQRIIGGGFMLVIGIIMLGFLFDLQLVNNFSGPFSDQLNTVETVLGAAIVFSVLGLLALAGVYAYSMFQNA